MAKARIDESNTDPGLTKSTFNGVKASMADNDNTLNQLPFFIRVEGHDSNNRRICVLAPVPDIFDWEGNKRIGITADEVASSKRRWSEKLAETAGEAVAISLVELCEYRKTVHILTQEDLDDDPEWEHDGYSVGDKISEMAIDLVNPPVNFSPETLRAI